jgi:hypothetical protein
MSVKDRTPLPSQVRDLLECLDAPPRLVAHLTLVYEVAGELTRALDRQWPNLTYDRQAVLIGAATHDIGKVLQRHELTGPGHEHEECGPSLLTQHGFAEQYTRYARTHGQWARTPDVTLEDLLVALADGVWRGKRDSDLEDLLVQRLSDSSSDEPWAVYSFLDDMIGSIARDADARLGWQTQFPV